MPNPKIINQLKPKIMFSEDQIEIPLSKQKLYLMLAGAVMFVCIGFCMLLKPALSNHNILGNKAFVLISGTASILFFGFIAIMLLIKLSENKPGLIINSEGFVDNSSAVSAGIVMWDDIVKIAVTKVMNQTFLMFIVKNPEEYIKRQKGAVKRKTMEINYKSYGSPISISANTLDTNFEELYELLQRKFKESKLKPENE